MNPIDNHQAMIDSRDVIERIEELKNEFRETTGDNPDDYAMSEDDWLTGLGYGERDELVALMTLQDEAGYFDEWADGVTLVAEFYFMEYARELADDMGLVSQGWPFRYIDWAAASDSLLMDYSSVEFDGQTYYVR